MILSLWNWALIVLNIMFETVLLERIVTCENMEKLFKFKQELWPLAGCLPA